MEKIVSMHPEKRGMLCHVLIRKDDITETRINVSNDNEPLQLSYTKVNKYDTFIPHIHIHYDKTVHITQESWVVVQGSINIEYYDIDKSYLCSKVLYAGDCSITYYGGHTYQSLEDGTLIYEFKNGPYLGQEFDKKRFLI